MGVTVTVSSARFVVDRREGEMVVVEDADGTCHDVPAKDLPRDCREEGAVLDVPTTAGVPRWGSATRDRAEEGRRVTDLTNRMNALRRRDPGGDVEL